MAKPTLHLTYADNQVTVTANCSECDYSPTETHDHPLTEWEAVLAKMTSVLKEHQASHREIAA